LWGDHETRVLVVGETSEQYRIEAIEGMRLGRQLFGVQF